MYYHVLDKDDLFKNAVSIVVLWPIRQHALAGTPTLRTGRFRWSKVLLPTCPCLQQLAHSD